MTTHDFQQQITFLYTRDLDSTAYFYEEVMGLPLDRDQGDCRIYRVSAGGFVGFCQREAAPEHPHGVIITFILGTQAAVDGWYAKLAARGAVFQKEPELNPKYNIYHCFLHDPNGYLLEIQAFLD